MFNLLNKNIMKTGILNRTIRFKFGQSLPKGLKVEIRQTNESTFMVRHDNEPTIEYIVSKDAVSLIKEDG